MRITSRVDLNTLFKDVASEYLMTIMDPTQARHVIDRAIRIAQALRIGVVPLASH